MAPLVFEARIQYPCYTDGKTVTLGIWGPSIQAGEARRASTSWQCWPRGRSPKRGEHCFWGWSFRSTVTGVSPASARWMCGPSSLSSTRRTDICSRPFMWGFLSSGAWDLGSQSRDCGKFLQYPKSKQVPAGVEGVIANHKKAVGCRQSCFGLDWLPRASSLQATWPSFLAPE